MKASIFDESEFFRIYAMQPNAIFQNEQTGLSFLVCVAEKRNFEKLLTHQMDSGSPFVTACKFHIYYDQ